MAGEAALKLTKQQIWASIRRDIFSKQMVGCLILVLSGPLWFPPVTYLTLRTFLFDANGILATLIIVVLGAVGLWAWMSLLAAVTRRGKILRSLRQAVLAGDEDAKKQYEETRLDRPSAIRFALAYGSLLVIMPAIIAIIIGRGTTAGEYLVRDHGKLRQSTRQESVQMTLSNWERRGIYSILNR